MTDNPIYSTMIRGGKTTYFIDVKEAKNGNKYIAITESRISEGDGRKRTCIRVFGENIDPFKQAVAEAAEAVQS